MNDSKPRTYLHDGLLQKRHTIRVTRTQYGLVVGVRASAKKLKEALASIPDDARIIDIEDYKDSDASLTHNTLTDASVYVFEVEQERAEVEAELSK